MREVVLDTETTGLDPHEGHKIVEIGCVELFNHLPTGNNLHIYINPEREVPAESVAVHGLTDKFLADKPTFAEIYTEFIDFISGSRLVIHNAAFDIKFLNHELQAVGHKPIPMNVVTDTLLMARQKFPGSPANLDFLCRRFGIDNSARELHGALLDSELLAEVYIELLGGRQHNLDLLNQQNTEQTNTSVSLEENSYIDKIKNKPFREPRNFVVSEDEKQLHSDLLSQIPNNLWQESK